MANHGSVAVGATLDKAVEHALLLEWLATLHHRASALGTPRVLTDEQQADVITPGDQPQLRNHPGEPMKIATVGVHVLDTHVIGIESIPEGSDGQLVETIRLSPAGTAGGTAVVLGRLGRRGAAASARSATDPIGDEPARRCSSAEGVDVAGLVRKADHQTSASVIPVRPNGDRPAWHCIGANGAFTLDDLDLDRARGDHPPAPRRPGVPRRRGRRASCSRTRRSIGATTSLDILAPGRPGHARPGSPTRCRTPTTCCPTTSRCWASPAPPTLAEGARALVDAGVGCVAVTQGAKGALVVTADETIEVPAYDDRRRRHHRLRRRVLRRLPARAVARPRPARRRRARLRDRGPGGPGARHRRRVLRPGLRRGVHHRRVLTALRRGPVVQPIGQRRSAEP